VEASAGTQERVSDLVRSAPEDGTGWVWLDEVVRAAPVRTPNSLRDFLAFRDHVERGAARRGTPVPEAWNRIPVYFKGNRRTVVGPGDVVVWPSSTEQLDYECEVAAVVGPGGRDVPEDEAGAHVFGWRRDTSAHIAIHFSGPLSVAAPGNRAVTITMCAGVPGRASCPGEPGPRWRPG
jgi:2-keto-4-pentenoate hydratase/2-oxohepta-3-ene-1,7-dioic acid hydratase in catechol pathway